MVNYVTLGGAIVSIHGLVHTTIYRLQDGSPTECSTILCWEERLFPFLVLYIGLYIGYKLVLQWNDQLRYAGWIVSIHGLIIKTFIHRGSPLYHLQGGRLLQENTGLS